MNIPGGIIGLATQNIPAFGSLLEGVSAFDLLTRIKVNPLVLVHGFNSNWTMWASLLGNLTGERKTINELSKQFKEAKTEDEKKAILLKVQELLKKYNIYVYDYSDKKDGRESPDVVGKDFAEFLKKNNLGSNTNVITHSMGGLVVREAIEFNGVKLNKLAMISPPNQGSPYAITVTDTAKLTQVVGEVSLQPEVTAAGMGMEMAVDEFAPALNYMTYDSPQLNQLNSYEKLNVLFSNVKNIMVFSSPYDLVVPSWKATIPGAEGRYTYKNFTEANIRSIAFSGTHLTIYDNYYVQKWVIKALYGKN